MKQNLRVAASSLPASEEQKQNAIDEVELASNGQLLKGSRRQLEPKDELVACIDSQQPAIIDISRTAVASKCEKFNARMLSNASPAFKSSPPIAPKPKRMPKFPGATPVATATSPKKKIPTPNSVLIMPTGLAEQIALRSPGGVRDASNHGGITTPESIPKAKRPKLTPPGAVCVMPMDMSPLVGRRRRDGGEQRTEVLTNGVALDHDEEEAVSFDEVRLLEVYYSNVEGLIQERIRGQKVLGCVCE